MSCAGRVSWSWGLCQPGWQPRKAGERGHRWHQAAFAGTGVFREPLAWHPFPFPCSRLSPGDANPNPGAVGEWGFIFRDGKLGAGFRRTQRWAVGTVLTVCNLSETPILTLESFFFNLLYPVFTFQCFAGNSLFQWNTVGIFGVNGSPLNWELANL